MPTPAPGGGPVSVDRVRDTVPGVRSDVDTVRGYLAAFERGDADEIVSFVADGLVNEHLAELGSGCVGRDEYRRRLPGFLADFAGVRYTVIDTVVDTGTEPGSDMGSGARTGCSTVVVRYRLRATHDGTDVDVPGIMWCTVLDGEITHRTDLWDSLTFLRQTGRA